MTRLMDPKLQKLSASMSEMGELAIQSVDLAVTSYTKGINTVAKVRDLSEHITSKYHDVGDLIFSILLKFQPLASDFRFIRSAIEISYSFHRFGRYAYDIAMVCDKFGNIAPCKTEWLYRVSNETLRMTKDALISFALLDTGKAGQIQDHEDYVDRLYHERIEMLVSSDDARCAQLEVLLLNYLERIADHAVFMSRAVNYIVTGDYAQRRL